MAINTKHNNLEMSLGASISDGESKVAEQSTAPSTAEIGRLHPGKYQPRHDFDDLETQELAASIKSFGILQPILVRRSIDFPGDYEIIAGERRWRAAQSIQLDHVPIIVKEFTDLQSLEVALVENLQRRDLSALEEAEGYQCLIEEFSHTQEDLSKILGKSRSHVANTLRLLQLPDDLKKMLKLGDLSTSHARALLNAGNSIIVAKEVVRHGLNVRQTEKLVQSLKSVPKTKRDLRQKDAFILGLEKDLSSSLGLKVLINANGSSGAMSVFYTSLGQLGDLHHRLADKIDDEATPFRTEEANSDEDIDVLSMPEFLTQHDSDLDNLKFDIPLIGGKPSGGPPPEENR